MYTKGKSYWGVIANLPSKVDAGELVKKISYLKMMDFAFVMLTAYDIDNQFSELAKFCKTYSSANFLSIPAVQSIMTKTKYLPDDTRIITSSPLNLEGSLAYYEDSEKHKYERIEQLREKDGFCYIYSPRKEWRTKYVPYVYFNGFAWDGKEKREFQSVVDYYLAQRLRTKIVGVSDLGSVGDKNRLVCIRLKSPNLTKEAVVKAISSGGCYISDTKDIIVDFKIGETEIGNTHYTKSLSMVDIEIQCHSNADINFIQVVKNARIIRDMHPQKESYRFSFKDRILGEAYYRVMAVDSAGCSCFSNPIFVKTDDWRWGDHHLHTGPRRSSFLAGEIGLDYAQLTDHINPGEEGTSARPDELKRYCTDKFLVLPGVEFHRSNKSGSKYGAHILAFPMSGSYKGGVGVKRTLDQLEENGALAFIAHPFIEENIAFGGFPSFQEKDYFYPKFNGIEIVHGTSYHFVASPYELKHTISAEEAMSYVKTEQLWDDCLTLGMRCTGIANTDALVGAQFPSSYTLNWGVGLMPTITYAKKLQPKDIYRALKSGYCWLTNGTFRYLNIWLKGRCMGQVFKRGDTEKSADLRVLVESVKPMEKIVVISNGKVMSEIDLQGKYLSDTKTDIKLPECLKYLRVKVIDKEGGIAFSNPIYLHKPVSKAKAVKILARRGYKLCQDGEKKN